MASSRNYPVDLTEALAAELARRFAPGTAVAVALSGGLDSICLLHGLHAARQRFAFALTAHHVCHGLSGQAGHWVEFCAQTCARLDLPFSVTRLNIRRAPQESLEEVAREARHAALRALDVAVVAMAHHADDQAETVLLQLLRGAGVAGLAAMPEFAPGRPALWRPLLRIPRGELTAWARVHGLTWIEDDSNADLRLRRNFLRHQIAPLLAAQVPGYPQTLARSAGHCAEAAELLADLAAQDGLPREAWQGLSLTKLHTLTPARARNLLRHFFLRAGLLAPSAARLQALLRSLSSTRPDHRTQLRHQSVMLVREGTQLHIVPPPGPFDLAWRGETKLRLPHGELVFEPSLGAGLAVGLTATSACRVVPCPPGARLALLADRPSGAVRELLRQRGVPVWARRFWPAVLADGKIVAIPGLGVAAEARCGVGEIGTVPIWKPDQAATARLA
ncbi:MAG: tRNA lysidine(34) synthetase TilS [Betaproteobacteria bacterium]|nr:tRNA lysidine(34) synthetase TilS [Betaproteobacteria bacterium]